MTVVRGSNVKIFMNGEELKQFWGLGETVIRTDEPISFGFSIPLVMPMLDLCVSVYGQEDMGWTYARSPSRSTRRSKQGKCQVTEYRPTPRLGARVFRRRALRSRKLIPRWSSV